MQRRTIIARLAAAAAIAGFGGFTTTATADLVYGVTDTQTLLTWDTTTPNDVTSGTAISGMMPSEQIRGIDFRPASGQLYAVGSFSNLYTIDVSTGVASRVGGGPFSPGLNGSAFGFDFNPTIDRIRVVSEVDQNLVLNPITSASTQVTDLFYAAGDDNFGVDPNVVASAYTNSFDGAMTTQLYGVDTALDVLVTQANSAGTLETVGGLGVDINDTASFDISGFDNMAYMSVQTADFSQSAFWTIDLSTGEASMIGQIGAGARITGIALAPVPAPGAIALLGLAGLTGTRRRCA